MKVSPFRTGPLKHRLFHPREGGSVRLRRARLLRVRAGAGGAARVDVDRSRAVAAGALPVMMPPRRQDEHIPRPQQIGRALLKDLPFPIHEIDAVVFLHHPVGMGNPLYEKIVIRLPNALLS